MKFCFWRKNFTNCCNVRVEVGPFCAGLWKHDASRLWEWYEQFLCSLKTQMDVNTQTLHIRKLTPWAAWCQNCGRKQILFHVTLSQLTVTPVAPLHQVSVTSISTPAEPHMDIPELHWPAHSLVLFKTGLGFFLNLLIECSPRQQLVSCQSKDKVA